MVRNKTDLNYYNSTADEPDYKGWFLQSISKDGTYYFVGGVDPGVLPKAEKGIPAGSTALGTNGVLYDLSGDNTWNIMVEV